MARFNAAELLPELSLGLCPCLLCGGSLGHSDAFSAQNLTDSKRSQQYFCEDCYRALPWLQQRCTRCALPLSLPSPLNGLCGECLQKPPRFARIEACWHYQPPLAQLIVGFKHSRRYSYGQALASIAGEHIVKRYDELPDWLCPTPLHWRRRLRRGFNQSEQLAACFAKTSQRPIKRCLQRIKLTPAQQGLDADERKRNLRGSFRVAPGFEKSIAGKRIALIDDVVTTGATANEISRCFLEEGAAEVHIWCLARTPKPA